MTAQLVTIPFSHYCEKARWAADWTGFAYHEDKHIPGAHVPATRRHGGRTVPMLVTRHGVLKDSTDILRFLDDVARGATGRARLFPDDEGERRDALEWETLFDDTLGPATRLFAYAHGLEDRAALARVVAPSLSLTQRLAFRALLPLLGNQLRRYYRIDTSTVAQAEASIRDVFVRVSERLTSRAAGRARDGAPDAYLVGDAFGAADLTFASLAAPVLRPPGHPSFTSEGPSGLPAIDALADTLHATPAGAHARRMYREHRRGPTAR